MAGSLTTNYDVSQIFIGGNHYESATYTNSTGSSVSLAPGRLMGRVLASDKVLPNISSATDGSELPIGICASTVTVADGATVTIDIVTAGDVNENKVTLGSGDTWSTAVRTVSTGGGTLRDLLRRNTGIKLFASTELSATDNQ